MIIHLHVVTLNTGSGRKNCMYVCVSFWKVVDERVETELESTKDNAGNKNASRKTESEKQGVDVQ